jgi:putative inorganic carbon (HCO3(-)) transporter
LLLSGTVVSIISLIYLIQDKLDPFGRLQAFYNSPNYLAMYIAPALIVGVGYYLFTFLASPSETRSGTPPSLPSRKYCGTNHARSGCVTRKKIIPNASILAFFAIILLSVILFFTKSFGAWLGIIAAVCFGVVFYLYKSGRKQFALTILYLVLLIIVFLGYYALIQKESSFDARLIIWQKSWEIFKANPVLGIGPGTFGDYFPSYPEWGVPQPHSIFLAFLLQTGILGLVGFVWLLAWFFRTGIRNYLASRMQEELGIRNVVLMMVMIYILVHGLVDATYWKNDLAVVFWLVVGLMVVIKIQKSKSPL